MTTQQRSFLIRLALLGLLVGLAEPTAGEDEDYYMQELLTRDLYNQVRIQETPVASIPAKKAPKEKKQGTKRLKNSSVNAARARNVQKHDEGRRWLGNIA